MQVRAEIQLFALEEDKAALLWLLGKYHWQSQWRFVAQCEPVRYGPSSYQTHRRWFPTHQRGLLSAA